MEGPSLLLAAERLQPFVGQVPTDVSGNTTVGKERIEGRRLREVFAWGKHLVFQFDGLAFRIHFMMYGSYEATVSGVSVTGDYKRTREPRLKLRFANGDFAAFNCSIKWIESDNARASYDFSADTMSPEWNGRAALRKMRARPESGIGDVLLDQTIFAGVGNIIRNEVLWRQKVHPLTKVRDVSPTKLRAVVKDVPVFCRLFYVWRRDFVLRKHLQIHRKPTCPRCGAKTTRQKTGELRRWSFFCPQEQRRGTIEPLNA